MNGSERMTKTIIKKKRINLRLIKKLREDNGLSQACLARTLGLKSPDKYTRRENGDYNFKADELQMLSEFYKVSMEKFFTI